MRRFFIPQDHSSNRSIGEVSKGVIAGAIGGFVASWAMNQAHGLAGNIAKLTSQEEDNGEPARESSEGENPEHEEEVPATVKTATAISRRILKTELSDEQKKAAGSLVHYGYGTAMGAVYGGICEFLPKAGLAAGIPFGAVLWLIGDEIGVPLMGFSKPPTQIPASVHADALAAHAIYGLAADGTRRIIRDGI